LFLFVLLWHNTMSHLLLLRSNQVLLVESLQLQTTCPPRVLLGSYQYQHWHSFAVLDFPLTAQNALGF
jgi:hypothetical protein